MATMFLLVIIVVNWSFKNYSCKLVLNSCFKISKIKLVFFSFIMVYSVK